MDRLHGFFVKCHAKDDCAKVIVVISEAFGYETKKGRLVVKIVNHHSNFRQVMFVCQIVYQK
jgi:hypothetical protein